MKIWSMREMRAKVFTDSDLLDETFVSLNELSGYFNEAITECKSEISELNKDYFLTKYYIPLVVGQSRYDLPFNILANKIRGIMYQNGSVIYPIVQYRRRYKFQNIAFTDQYGSADDYRYTPVNDVVGQAQLDFHPPSRETAILPPNPGAFTPAVMWYIRNCARVPMIAINGDPAEYCNPEVIFSTAVSVGADTIQTLAGSTTIGVPQQGIIGAYPGSVAYITGDTVKFQSAAGGTLPAPLVAGTVYYVIAGANGLIKVATTLANALGNVAIDLTTVGVGSFILTVGATETIVLATLIDIPEFAEFVMQWVKVRCMAKEKDNPNTGMEAQVLADMKQEMVDTLTNAIPDDDDEIEPDFSHYQEMS